MKKKKKNSSATNELRETIKIVSRWKLFDKFNKKLIFQLTAKENEMKESRFVVLKTLEKRIKSTRKQ